jgi:hypothetical protein
MTKFKLHLSTDHKSMKPGPVNMNTVSMYGPDKDETAKQLPPAYRQAFLSCRKPWLEVRPSGCMSDKPVLYKYLKTPAGKYINTLYAFEVQQ